MSTETAITEHEAAARLQLSVATLRAWRHRATGPPFVRFGRAVRYLSSDLDMFINSCRVDTVGRFPATVVPMAERNET
jgi:predicted DNA-binding transcriptional regulator AlpA